MFCVYNNGFKFNKWFDTFEEAVDYAFMTVATEKFDCLWIGDETTSYSWVDKEGYHIQKDY